MGASWRRWQQARIKPSAGLTSVLAFSSHSLPHVCKASDAGMILADEVAGRHDANACVKSLRMCTSCTQSELAARDI